MHDSWKNLRWGKLCEHTPRAEPSCNCLMCRMYLMKDEGGKRLAMRANFDVPDLGARDLFCPVLAENSPITHIMQFWVHKKNRVKRVVLACATATLQCHALPLSGCGAAGWGCVTAQGRSCTSNSCCAS